jgi:anti-sigma factor RsiW
MTQTCQSGVELLTDYLEGALPHDARAALEQHVAGCQRCAAFVESYRRTPALLRNATAVSLPPDLARALQDLVRAQGRAKKGSGHVPPKTKK